MHDVVIIGGGPAGSTAGTFLKKFRPELDVLILEREKFPRDHVGESLLPVISRILYDMGCWDKIEAANFPIKIGATYRWGRCKELWDFEFFPSKLFKEEPRPAPFDGQRVWTALQVDRAIYDKILLDHAEEMGCEVRQETRVVKVGREGDRVTGLTLESGETVEGRFYFDASGNSAILRKSLGVKTEVPTSLQNIAIWDYWQNAEWAVEIGVGATRIQVLSLSYGWIWFIPLGPTRTSIGLVVPVDFYKRCGMKPQELYLRALAEEDMIAALIKDATCEGKLQTTNDWSFLSERHVGENWFLVGESSGFADPILSAGLSVTHVSAKEAAFTVLELLNGKEDRSWLLNEYEQRQNNRIRSHIRFADYWYTVNAQFSDLKEFTQKIAADNGLDLSPDKAWAWLAQGGFIDSGANIGSAGFTLDSMKKLGEFLTELSPEPITETKNVFKLDLSNATWQDRALYREGRVQRIGSYMRGSHVLPLIGVLDFSVQVLQRASRIDVIMDILRQAANDRKTDTAFVNDVIGRFPHALEAMISDGWITASLDPNVPMGKLPVRVSDIFRWNEDNREGSTQGRVETSQAL